MLAKKLFSVIRNCLRILQEHPLLFLNILTNKICYMKKPAFFNEQCRAPVVPGMVRQIILWRLDLKVTVSNPTKQTFPRGDHNLDAAFFMKIVFAVKWWSHRVEHGLYTSRSSPLPFLSTSLFPWSAFSNGLINSLQSRLFSHHMTRYSF